MKLKVLAVSLLAFFAISASAFAGFVEYPTITEGEAKEDSGRFLHKSYGAWRYRSEGYLDCSNGRINRYTWVCRAGWRKGNICTQGRLRLENEYREGSRIHYLADWRGRRC